MIWFPLARLLPIWQDRATLGSDLSDLWDFISRSGVNASLLFSIIILLPPFLLENQSDKPRGYAGSVPTPYELSLTYPR